MNSNYVYSLNGLRAMSIMMVIASHLIYFDIIPSNTLTKLLGLLFFNGGLGVSIFFVISGFLITKLLIWEKEEKGRISLRSFYVRRALRIFPAYYLLLMVYYLIQRVGLIDLSASTWISSLTYTNQFFKGTEPETIHLWTLSAEEFFYLLWPMLYLVFFSRVRLGFLYGAILLFSVLRFYNCFLPDRYYNNTIVSTGDALLIGCLIAIRYEPISRWVIKNKNTCLLAFPLLVLLIFLDVYTFHLASSGHYSSGLSAFVRLLSAVFTSLCGNKGLFTDIVIGIIMVYSINIKGTWFKFLNLWVINYIGILSYSLYLWQQVVIAESQQHYHLSVPVILLLIIVFANLSYHFVERPFLVFKDKLKSRQRLRMFPVRAK